VVVGELDDPETYRRLRIEHAALVVVMNDDIVGTNVIYTLREASESVVTVANADLEDSVDILRLAGSTYVFQFTHMLGQALARRVLGVSMKANVIGRFDQLLIAEAPAMRTWLQGKTLAESRLRQATGVTVVGIWEQSRFVIPAPQTRIEESTVLVLAGTEAQLDRFDRSIAFTAEGGPNEAPVIVLGGGRVGQSVAEALGARGIDFRVVEKRSGIVAQDSRFIQGSAADRDTLDKAGIRETPSIIITTHDDNLNIYLTIYCRRLRPDVQIISRASLDRNIKTLHRAGANLVMSFSSMVTTTIMNLLEPQQMLMLSEGLNVFRVGVPPKLENMDLLHIQVRETTGCSIVAVKRQDELMINPDPTIVLERGDELVLIGSAESEKKFAETYHALESTGGAQLIAEQLLLLSAHLSPMATLAVIMGGTMLLSNVVNNAAAAVLMAPIAITLARGMEISVDPLLMSVAVGASCAFLTPVGHQSNALVMAPGGYRFGDYWRLGLPMSFLVIIIAIPLIYYFWPMQPV